MATYDKKTEAKKADDACPQFVMLLFNARTAAHIMHLQTRSFAQHKALEQFYTEIGGLADDFAEAYQGRYGIIEDYPAGFEPPSNDAFGEIRDIGVQVKALRKNLPQETELQNIIDEIAGLIDQTMYKLRYLD